VNDSVAQTQRVAKNGAWRCTSGHWNPPYKTACETCWEAKQDAAYLDLLLAAAKHPDSEWKLKGSKDWSQKLGRLTVSLDLDEQKWDDVYDALNAPEDVLSLG
jgi:hypothetical protein